MVNSIIEHLSKIIKFRNLYLALFIVILSRNPVNATIVNEVWATINDSPITSLDIIFLRLKIPMIKEIFPLRVKTDNQMLNFMINQQLIDQIADEETIKPPSDKVNSRVNLLIKANKLKTREELDKKLKRRGSSLEVYVEEIRRQLVTNQIMSLFVPANPPRESEIRSWYKKNKRKLGLMVRVKQIVINYNPRSIKSELVVDKKLRKIRSQILKKRASFENMAKKHSGDKRSASRGGDLGWLNLAEMDQMKATMAYQLRKSKRGALSPVFKAKRRKQYVLLKMMGSRGVEFSKIKDKIFRLLYAQSQDKAFMKWLELKKRDSAITIFKKGYKALVPKGDRLQKDSKTKKKRRRRKKSQGHSH